MALRYLPGEVLARINFLTDSRLYLEDSVLCNKVRSVVTEVRLRLLHSTTQTRVYPRLKSVHVYSIDLVAHGVSDYLPPTVTRLNLENVVATEALLQSIPIWVKDVSLGIGERSTAESRFTYHNEVYSITRAVSQNASLHTNISSLVVNDMSYGELSPSLESLCDERGYLASLPSTVKSIHCYSLGEIHPHLTTIVLQVPWGSNTGLSLSSLPSGLEKLVIRYLDRVEVDAGALPFSLTELSLPLHVQPADDVNSELGVLLLASRVTKLSLDSCDPAIYTRMPLTELHLDSVYPRATVKGTVLPLTLRKLRIKDAVSGALPEGIEELHLSFICDKDPAIPPVGLRVLVTRPTVWRAWASSLPNLTSLSVNSETDMIQSYGEFPHSLLSLDFGHDHVDLVSLPPHLTHLHMLYPTKKLPLPDSLLSLTVNHLDYDFPSGLRELDIHYTELCENSFGKLSPHLTRLHCYAIGQGDYMQLPRSLGNIRLSYDNDTLSPRSARHPALQSTS